MKIRNAGYSRYYDVKTGVEFLPELDRQTGCYVAIADVDKKKAKEFDGREGFEVLTDDQYTAMTITPEPEEPETGNPVNDAAKTAGQSAPPPPPPSN